jgi:hypothetical protein
MTGAIPRVRFAPIENRVTNFGQDSLLVRANTALLGEFSSLVQWWEFRLSVTNTLNTQPRDVGQEGVSASLNQ